MTIWKNVKVAIAGFVTVLTLNNTTKPTQAQSQPVIVVNTVYYPITGKTASQLRQQMNQLGPIDKSSGSRFDGRTDWYVRWNYRYLSNNNRCKLTAVSVKTEVVTTLPQWNSPPNASKALVKRWNQYLKALRLHENGHKDNGIAASREVSVLLEGLPGQRSCSKLEAAANTSAQRMIQKYNQRDVDYDRVTRHGTTQGAVFSG